MQDNGPGPDKEHAVPLSLDDTVPVQVTAEKQSVTFSFTPTESDLYLFESFDNDEGCDPVFYLYDVNGTLLAEHDDIDKSNFNFKYECELDRENTYYLMVTYYFLGKPGSFNVKLTQNGKHTSGSCGDAVTWRFEKASDKLTISGTGAMTSYGYINDYQLRIKTVVIGDGVTSICDSAFAACGSLDNVTIPSSVTSIGAYAFYNCVKLATVNMPETRPELGYQAFYGTPWWEATLPPSGTCGENVSWSFEKASGKLTISGNGPMTSSGFNNNYQDRIKTVVIENGVTSVCDSAFYNCGSLETVTIPSGLTSIGASAFYYCNSLDNVTIPATVTSIGQRAFYNCGSLENVTMPTLWPELGYEAFSGTPWWANNKTINGRCGKEVTWSLDKASGKLTISGNGKMTSNPFKEYDGDSIQTVEIENGVTSIYNDAFSYCGSLASVTIPSSVLVIKPRAFYNCDSLTSVTIPSGVLVIGESAFSDCGSLATVNMPNPWPELGSRAFYGSPWWTSNPPTSGTCGENVSWSFDKDSGKLTISGTGEMTSSGFSDDYRTSIQTVEIGNGVTSICGWAFSDCDSLATVTLPDPWHEFSSRAFSNTPWWNANSPTSGKCGDNVTWSFDKASNKLTISGTGEMTSNPFMEDYGERIQTVEIENGVTSICESAFEYCESLTSVTIPDSVTFIRDEAFCFCYSLATVTLPTQWPELGFYCMLQNETARFMNRQKKP